MSHFRYWILTPDNKVIETTRKKHRDWWAKNFDVEESIADTGGRADKCPSIIKKTCFLDGIVRVSSVFLMIEHCSYMGDVVINGEKRGALFETMIFVDADSPFYATLNEHQWRSHTVGESLGNHNKACDFVIAYIEAHEISNGNLFPKIEGKDVVYLPKKENTEIEQ